MSKAGRRVASSIRVLAVACTLAAQSAAQNDTATAEALFRDGRRLLEEKQYGQACPKLAESYRIDAATGALLALAMCHEGEGKVATAWAEYNDVATRSRREQRADRERAARDRVAALEPRLPRLMVRVAPGVEKIAGLEVKRDGAAVRAGAWGTAIPADPGEHVLEASAPGREPWQTKIVIGEGPKQHELVVPMLAEASTAMSTDSGATAKDRKATEAWEARRSLWRIVGETSAGVGAVGLGVGVAFGIQAKNKNDDSKSLGCQGNACPPAGRQARLDALAAGDVATVCFVAGGALLVGGVTLFLLAPKVAGTTQISVGSIDSLGTPGVVFDGRF